MRMGARDVGTSQWRRAAAFLAAGVGVAREGSAVLLASDFELINPAGEVLARDEFLGAVGLGAIDFLSDRVTSQIRVRRRGNTAVLRY
jgi:Domain of unknown function (DUF4440)